MNQDIAPPPTSTHIQARVSDLTNFNSSFSTANFSFETNAEKIKFQNYIDNILETISTFREYLDLWNFSNKVAIRHFHQNVQNVILCIPSCYNLGIISNSSRRELIEAIISYNNQFVLGCTHHEAYQFLIRFESNGEAGNRIETKSKIDELLDHLRQLSSQIQKSDIFAVGHYKSNKSQYTKDLESAIKSKKMPHKLEIFLIRGVISGDSVLTEDFYKIYDPLVQRALNSVVGENNSERKKELYSVGVISLFEAAKNYDLKSSSHFSRYAYNYIRNALMEAHEDFNLLDIPYAKRVQAQKLLTLIETQGDLSSLHTGTLTENRSKILELELLTKLSRDVVIDLIDNVIPVMNIKGVTITEQELTSEADGDSRCLLDFRHAYRDEIEIAFKHLTEIQRNVLILRYGFDLDGEPRTLEQVGRILHLSRERARQYEASALQLIRRCEVGRRLWETVCS